MLQKAGQRIKAFSICLMVAFGYKRPIIHQARQAADKAGKPMLNAGCGSAYTELSDVNLDIVPRQVDNFVCGDIQNLRMFKDKQFGAVYASHVLEHVQNPDIALSELRRVAEKVFIITPLPLWPWAWLHPEHKWVFWGTRKVAPTPFCHKSIATSRRRWTVAGMTRIRTLLERTKIVCLPEKMFHVTTHSQR